MKFNYKRFFTILISFVLLFSFAFSAVSVFATDDDPIPSTGSRKNGGPTYTEVVQAVNENLKELKNKKPKKESDAQKLLKAKTYDKAIASAVSAAFDLYENPDNADYLGLGYGVVSTAVTAVASCFGFGGVAEALMDGISGLFGDKPQSEIQDLQNHLDDQFEEMNNNLDEVQEEIGALSNQVDKQTEEIINALYGAFEAQTAKEEVMKFFTTSDGNFSYKLFKNYLYGSTSYVNNEYFTQAYYNKFVEDVAHGKNNDIIKEDIDSLYRALMSTDEHGTSNLQMFYEYLLADPSSGKESIQHYYYEYLSSNSAFLGDKNAEFEAYMFANDLYTTALFADNCVYKCNLYQFAQLKNQYGDTITDDAKYYYGDESTEFVTYGELKQRLFFEGDDPSISRIKLQMVKDLAYILNLDSSFSVVLPNGRFSMMTDRDETTFGNIIDGSTIYLNKLPPFVCADFGIDTNKFSYTWSYGNNEFSNNLGELVVDGNTDFLGNVLYDGNKIYSISFTMAATNSFAGGSGTEDDPYLISRKEHFELISQIKNGLYSHYLLVNDIDFNGETASPIGDEYEYFNGTLNGCGYTIKNLHINGDNTVGLFSSIGSYGLIENLKIDNFNIITNVTDDTTIYAGALAGCNFGTIKNCHITNSKVAVSLNSSELNKVIKVNAGGFCAYSAGDISYCSIDNLSRISASSTRDYKAEPDGSNQNCVNVGGIVAIIDNAYLGNCYSLAKISGNATSNISAGLHSRHPYIDVYVGGISARANEATIEKVFSDSFIEKCSFIAKDEQDIKVFFNNCHPVSHKYVANYDTADNNTIALSDKDKVDLLPFTTSSKYDVRYSFSKDAIYDNTLKVYEDQIYDCGDNFLKLDNLQININDDENVDYTVISYFFDATNSSKISVKEAIAKILLATKINEKTELFIIELPVIIKANKASKLVMEKAPSKLSYLKDEALSTTGGEFWLYFQDGSRINVTRNLILPADATSNYGKKTVAATMEGLSVDFEIEVFCESFFVNGVHNLVNTTVAPTCNSFGYILSKCSECNYYNKSDFSDKLEHSTTLQDAKDPTCTSVGYSGDLYCSLCDSIVEYGKEIPLAKHRYTNNGNVTSHACMECGLLEDHSFVTTENESSMIYTCVVCEHIYIENKVLSEDTPRVVVSEAYALAGGNNLVTVYVQMINNPGITGASFSVNFDERLELIDYSVADVLDTINAFNPHAERSACYFTMARAKVDYNDGNMLKLIFKVPDNANLLEEYDISISFSRSGTQFSDENNNPIDIITVDGGITIVNHLPGDVNNDDSVDILDTVLIARYLSGFNDVSFYKNYADIDIDGDIDITDLTRLLQNLVGGYDANAINNEYKIVLNTNDGSSSLSEITVKCFDDNGNRNSYEILNGVSTPTRDGYRFDGWYTAFSGGELVTSDSKIFYNRTQPKQTLYARWTPNTIIFDGNGATSGQMSNITYNGSNSFVSITNTYSKFTTIFINSLVSDALNTNRSLNQTFLGWSLAKDSKEIAYKIGDTINLKDGDIGELTLYAVWSNEKFDMPVFTKEGCTLKGWQLNSYGLDTIENMDTDHLENGTVVYAKWATIEYSIVYNGNGATSGNVVDTYSSRNITETHELAPNSFGRVGYKFTGWNTEPNGNGLFFNDKQVVSYIGAEVNGVVTLYAQWEIIDYDIVYHFNDPGVSDKHGTYTVKEVNIPTPKYSSYSDFNYFLGWYEDSALTIPFKNDLTTNPRRDTLNLYAKWDLAKVYNYYKTSPDANTSTGYTRFIYDWSNINSGDKLSYYTEVDSSSIGANGNLWINNGVTDVYFIGRKDLTYKDLYIYLANFSSNSNVTIHLIDFNFTGFVCSQNHPSVLNVTIDIPLSNTTSSITSLSSSSPAIGWFSNLAFTGSGTLKVYGHDGADSPSNSYNGENGGVAINAGSMTVNMSSTGKLYAYGGDGGDGHDGSNGSRGYDGTSYGDWSSSNGGHGGNGGSGTSASSGGAGASAIVVDLKLTVNSALYAYSGNGGDGGDGGNGGRGGNGGSGGSNYAFGNCSAGTGGNGGYGGAGGNAGNGGNVHYAVSAGSINVNTTSYSNVNGTVGKAGSAGVGGYGGSGGAGGWKCTGIGNIHNSVDMRQMASGTSHSSEQASSGRSGSNGSIIP